MATHHPGPQAGRHFVKVPCEEMIGSGNEKDASRFRGIGIKCLDEALEVRFCCVLIIFSLNQQLRFRARTQIVEPKLAIIDRQPEADQFHNSGISATSAQADPSAKAEARYKQMRARKVGLEIVERGTDVVFLTPPAVVASLACAHAAKVEAQDQIG